MKIYHTETQEDYDALMVELEEQGFTWWHYIGEKPTDNNYWNNNKENTCVRAIPKDKELMTMHKKHYITEYPQTPIIKYKAKADEKMRFTKENVEAVVANWFWKDGNSVLDELVSELRKLDDTPEKVVVPEFVAEFYEKCEDAPLSFLITQLEATYSRSELGKWYSSCSGRHRNGKANAQEVIAKMKLYGYEVEKEPLYEVLIPYVRWSDKRSELVTEYQKLRFDKTSEATRFVHRSYIPSSNDYTCSLSESDIKEIDERFWLFAKPVTELECNQ